MGLSKVEFIEESEVWLKEEELKVGSKEEELKVGSKEEGLEGEGLKVGSKGEEFVLERKSWTYSEGPNSRHWIESWVSERLASSEDKLEVIIVGECCAFSFLAWWALISFFFFIFGGGILIRLGLKIILLKDVF